MFPNQCLAGGDGASLAGLGCRVDWVWFRFWRFLHFCVVRRSNCCGIVMIWGSNCCVVIGLLGDFKMEFATVLR